MTATPSTAPGRIVRLSGPTVTAAGLGAAAIGERVLVGAARLPGEIIRLYDELGTLQVFEDTNGLALGEPVVLEGEPLMVELGPGLLGRIFDGIQRPLARLAEADAFLRPGAAGCPPLERERVWRFEPAVAPGARVTPGARVGSVRESPSLRHAILCPPDHPGGVVAEVRAGDARVTDAVVTFAGEPGAAPPPPLTLLQRWPVKRPRPFARRLPAEIPFLTGQRVLDVLFPIAAGGAAVIPGGFGTGKTVLEQTLAKFAAADVIVFVGCGERGNEMTDLLAEFPALRDPRTGAPLMDRTVLVVNTSNMPVAAREASIYTGVTIAEYYRDMGLHVALMADSTSRWAEALREIASRLEEMPGEEGYPTYLAARLSQFYERAGRVVPLSGEGEGAVTIVGAVSPPGGDFSEPVTQASVRVCGALWALAPELAQRRHFPAIDWARSFSLYAERLAGWMARAAGPEWAALRDRATLLLGRERELDEIVQLVGIEGIPDEERVVLEAARLLREGFLRQNAFSEVDGACPPAKALWMLRLLLRFFDAAAARVKAGVTWKRVAQAGLADRLLRMGDMPGAELEAAGAAWQDEIDRTLAALGGAS